MGRLFALKLGPRNPEGAARLYAGGINHARRQATLIVLDAATMAGAATEEDPEFQLAGFAPGVEHARVFSTVLHVARGAVHCGPAALHTQSPHSRRGLGAPFGPNPLELNCRRKFAHGAAFSGAHGRQASALPQAL